MPMLRLARAVLVSFLLVPTLLPAAEPRPISTVAADIDRLIEQRLTAEKVTVSPQSDDAEFLRRAYLDLTGRLPTIEHVIAFLDSTDSDKRNKLIDELLTNPNYGRHFALLWTNAIVRRDDANRNLTVAGFKSWLSAGFNDNRGWDKTVREMLTATGTVPPSTFFLAHQNMGQVAPNKVAGTVFNLFMGVQMQCAECHKHPFHCNWNREEFWELAAFFGKVTTTAGFATGITETVKPGALARLEIPDAVDPNKKTGRLVAAKFFEGDAPDLGDKGPFRPAVADWLTSPDNKFFAANAANRLWAHFFGRGLVHPLDDFHGDNPPSHPELLTMLTEEFKRSGFDQKHLIRCICSSQAYQRSSRPAGNADVEPHLLARMPVKVMNPDVLYDALTQVLGMKDLPQGRPAFLSFFTTKEEGDDPTEFSLGIPQFLRLMNSSAFNQGGPMIDEWLKKGTPMTKNIENLFLLTLSRRPTELELKKMTAYVERKDDVRKGYAGVLWVLINSAEFVCNR